MTIQTAQVFISYQRTDGDVAKQVRDHLVAAGVTTWIDLHDIPIGAYWPDAIDEGLTSSDIVVGILSPEAMTSRNVKNEWDWAIANDKRLLLLMIRPTSIPHRYISINFIDATGANHGQALDALIASLGIDTSGEQLPEIRYARSGDVNIAYMVVGDGPVDFVYVPGFVSNLEVSWEHPSVRRFYQQLGTFSRLILFDKRGTGLSDRVPERELPTLEQRMDDVRAVMDAAGSEHAVIAGLSEGGPMSVLFAATYPERTSGLVLIGAMVKGVWSPDFPWIFTEEDYEVYFENIRRFWGAGRPLGPLMPSVGDTEEERRFFIRLMRHGASPAAAIALERMNMQIDVRGVLPSIKVPTLVLHHVGDTFVPIGNGRYLAEHIPNARLVEFPGDAHGPGGSPHREGFVDEIQAFIAGLSAPPEIDSLLATILVVEPANVDVAESVAAELRSLARNEVGRYRGQVVRTVGTTILATFDGPARAIRTGHSIVGKALARGIEVRAGLHTGELVLLPNDVRGIAVQIATELAAQAAPGELLVTSTVKDLVAGSGISFVERSNRQLAGQQDTWRLYSVDRTTL